MSKAVVRPDASDGSAAMTSKDARHHVCRPGYWLVNVAPLGEVPEWIEQVAPQADTNKLFGYDKDEFLAKQYQR